MTTSAGSERVCAPDGVLIDFSQRCGSTFRFGDLLFVPLVCDYFNFVAFVIGRCPVDVYLGGKYYLETVKAARNHEVVLGGVCGRVSFVVKASVYKYVCFIDIHYYPSILSDPGYSCQA